MPRLPDWTSVGQPSIRESGRPVASIATKDAGTGMMAMGRGINSLGNVAQGFADRENAVDDSVGTSNATAYILRKISEADDERRNNPDKYPEWVKNYSNNSKKWLSEAGSLIKDGQKRRVWEARHRITIQRWGARVKSEAFGQERDANLAFNQKTLDEFRNKAVDLNTPEADKAMYIDTANGIIEDSRARGYISDVQAERTRKGWLEGYSLKRLEMMPAKERLAALGSAKHATPELATSISSVAKSIGIKPVDLATVISYETGGTFDPWKAGPTTQWGQHRGLIQWGEPQRKKYGITEGMPVAKQMEAVARYLKDAGVKPGMGLLDIYSAVNAGKVGRYNASDANNGGAPGTVADKVRNQMEGHKKKAAALVGGTYNDPVVGNLSPDIREKLYKQAEREIETNRKKDKFRVDGLVNDHLKSIETTGVGLPPETLSPEMIADALGPEKARFIGMEAERRQRVYNAMNGIERLSESEIDARVATLQPRAKKSEPSEADLADPTEAFVGKNQSTYEGYADDMRTYNEARAKAEKFKQARRDDPALAVRDFDNVASARDAKEYEDKNGIKVMTPASAQELIRQRLVAQQQIGIEAPLAVTKQEADVIARQLRLISSENREGMTQFLDDMYRTYGEYADEVLAATFQHARVSSELSRFASSILMGMQRGIIPSVAQAATYDTLTDMDELESNFPDYRRSSLGPRASAYGVPPNSPLGRLMRPDDPASTPPKKEDAGIPEPDRINRDLVVQDIESYRAGDMKLPELRQKYGTKFIDEVLKRYKLRSGERIGE
jgi:hypothetical protein